MIREEADPATERQSLPTRALLGSDQPETAALFERLSQQGHHELLALLTEIPSEESVFHLDQSIDQITGLRPSSSLELGHTWNNLVDWLAENPNRIQEFIDHLADKQNRAPRQWTLPLLALLAEVAPLDSNGHLLQIEQLCQTTFDATSPDLATQLQVLARLADPPSALLLIKLLDFVAHITMQEAASPSVAATSPFRLIESQARQERDQTPRYLIARLYHEIFLDTHDRLPAVSPNETYEHTRRVVPIAPEANGYYLGTYLQGISLDGQHLDYQELKTRLSPQTTISWDQTDTFYALNSLVIRGMVEEDLAIKLADFGLWQQRQLMQLLADASLEDVASLRNFLDEYGPSALSAVVAFDDGRTGIPLPGVIQELGHLVRGHTPNTAEAMFHAFGLVAYQIEHLENELFTGKLGEILPTDADTVSELRHTLFRRGQQLLKEYAALPDDQLRKRVDRFHADSLLTATVFSNLRRRNPDLNLTRFPAYDIEALSAASLADSDKRSMVDTVTANWASFPKLQAKINRDFAATLKDSASTFTLVRDQQTIVGFIRTKKSGETQIEASSLNIAEDLRGLGLGDAILREILGQIPGKIVATAYPLLPKIVSRYIGKFGFIATEIGDLLGYGEPFFRIVRDDRKHYAEIYQFYNRPTEEISELLGSRDAVESPRWKLYRLPAGQQPDLFLRELTRRFEPGWVLTAYRREPNQPTYLAFERLTETRPDEPLRD